MITVSDKTTPRGIQFELVAFCILLSLAPLFFMHDIVHLGELPRRLVLQPGVIFIVAIFLLRSSLSCRAFFLSFGLIPVLLVCLYALGSNFVSPNTYNAQSAFLTVLACLSATLIVSNFSLNKINRQWFLFAILLAACLTSLVGILQVWTGFDYYPSLAFPGSTYMNKNYAAHVCAAAIPVAIALFIAKEFRTWIQIFLLASGSLSWLYIQYAETRAAWLASVATCLGLLAISVLKQVSDCPRAHALRKWMLLCGVLLLTTVFSWYNPVEETYKLGGGVAERLSALVQQLQLNRSTSDEPSAPDQPISVGLSGEQTLVVDGSALGRLHSLKASYRMLKDHWLVGVGAGQFEVFYPPYDADGFKTKFAGDRTILRFLHNDYMQFLVEYGIIPAIFCLIFLIYLLFKIIRKSSSGSGLLAAYGGVCSLLIIAGLDGPFVKPTTQLFFATFLGIILGSNADFGKFLSIGQSRLARYAIGALGLVLCALSFFGLKCYHKRVIVERDFHLMNGYRQNGNPDKAVPYGRKAVARIEDFHMLGQAYGDLLSNTGNYRESKAQFEKVIAANPYDYLSHLKLAALNQYFGNDSEALNHYNICLQLVPSDSRVLIQCAQIFQEKNDYREAIRYLRQFIEAHPLEPAGYLMLAYNFEMMEDYERALEVTISGRSLLPENLDLREKYRQLLQLSGLDLDENHD